MKDSPPAERPAISVIICTWNRPHLLPRAVASVCRQAALPACAVEVIVIDDGSEPPVALPEAERGQVRLVRTAHRGVGAARAEGLAAARGDLIAYCDDDDEWLPDHLTTLYQELLDRPDVDLVYGDGEWEDGSRPPPTRLGEYTTMHAGNVLHRAAPARRVGGFDAQLPAYEDADLWLRMAVISSFQHVPRVLTRHGVPPARVSAEPHHEVFEWVYRVNMRSRSTRKRWQIYREKLGDTVVPFDPATWQPGNRRLLWQGSLDPGHSFGFVGRAMVRELRRSGVEVTLGPLVDAVSQTHHDLIRPVKPRLNSLVFVYDHILGPLAFPCERIVQLAMHETTVLPAHRVAETIRHVSLLYVPCRQNARLYREAGVTVPIRILHHGVDPLAFPYVERARDGRAPFTVGTFNDYSPRKGLDVLVRAFVDEFRAGEPVRLLLKQPESEAYARIPGLADPRIEFLPRFMPAEQLLAELGRMDVYVMPSRGEGFGLTALEAMATGLPVIATNWSGPEEYLDPADSYPLDYRMVDTRGSTYGSIRFFGEWAEPSYEHLRALLRHIYAHRDEANERGRRASQRVHTHWTWERVARQLIDDLDALAAGASPPDMVDADPSPAQPPASLATIR